MLVTTKLAAVSKSNFRHDILAKIGEHIDGTSGVERGCNTEWTLNSKTFPGFPTLRLQNYFV